MEKDFEKLFDDLKGSFDIEAPKDGHSERFLEKLKRSEDVVVSSKKPKSWMRPLAIAASMALLLTAGFFALKTDPSVKDQLAEISPEAANTQFYFASLIEEQVKVLQEESTPETERIIDDTLNQLQKLEVDYKVLENDILAGGNSKMILSAMITNFQTRIDLLQEVLDNIETIKNLKKSNDENYTI